MTKKIVRDELDKACHEFGGLVKDGFTMDDEFMVDLLDRIEKKRHARKIERDSQRQIASSPPYLKDVHWESEDQDVRIGGRGITKREFAMFGAPGGEIVWRQVVGAQRWWRTPREPWRVVVIHIMAWELAALGQTFPTPKWLDLKDYKPKRFRTMEEEMEDHINGEPQILNVEVPEKKERKKKATKRDILDAKYRDLMKLL
jgi:hypothetical protein